MMRTFLFFVVLASAVAAATPPPDLERSGTAYISPRLGISFPVGALADANYNAAAASWRKQGYTLSGEFGYFVSNSTVAGLELSYSTFGPRSVSVFGDADDSHVRIRRAGVFMQYSLLQSGKYRPFMRLGAGLFDASRVSMPRFDNDSLQFHDYTLGAKPVGTIGFGIHADFSPQISGSFAIEAVWLNSFSSAWDTDGASIGPLRKNMLYFPVYFGLLYHLADN